MTNWLDTYLEQMMNKIIVENKRLKGATPYIPYDGFYSDVVEERGVDWWANGFWSGLLWQLFYHTNRSEFRESAIVQEKRLDQALYEFNDIHHDVGFMWLLTSVADYRITGNSQSYRTGLHAANLLAGRFNIDGNFLVSWNDHSGWVVVDSMMNIQLLYWASEQTHDPRFAKVATRNANTIAKYLVREDGSVGQIASFNSDNGKFIEQLAGQGMNPNSAWSRGNAFALYGFALTYRHTKDKYYLEIAEKIAKYFIHECSLSEYVPLADFKAPKIPKLHDTSAGMIGACGILELSKWVSKKKGEFYRQEAEKIIKATSERYVNWRTEEDGIVGGGTEAYHRPATYEMPLIYSDYFFAESLLRLKDQELFVW